MLTNNTHCTQNLVLNDELPQNFLRCYDSFYTPASYKNKLLSFLRRLLLVISLPVLIFNFVIKSVFKYTRDFVDVYLLP